MIALDRKPSESEVDTFVDVLVWYVGMCQVENVFIAIKARTVLSLVFDYIEKTLQRVRDGK